MATVNVRTAKASDIEQVADLLVRLKRLNNEFDPHFTVVGDARKKAEDYLSDSLKDKRVLLMVATEGGKAVGVLRAEIRLRPFYTPSQDGHITDFYTLPEYRRKAIGNLLLRKASDQLGKMGAGIITMEFPTQNEIAARFFAKRGYRPFLQVFTAGSQ